MSLDTYIPVLRNKANEREVIQSFGGLTNFTSDEYQLNLVPLVEVSSTDDLSSLDPFHDAGDEMMVELPVYQTTRSTSFSETIQETLETYGDQVGFYLANSDSIDLPVVSGMADRSVSYQIHSSHHQDLHQQFQTVTHRLMIRGGSLDDDQRKSLEQLAGNLRPTDRVLFDVVDIGYNEDIEAKLEFLIELFDQQERAVLNLVNAFRDNRDNLTPRVASKLGVSGFGDFAINVRKPGGGPTQRVKIRHLHPEESVIQVFEGEDYTEASEALTEWDEWESDHCDYCQRASRQSGGTPSAWKRIRTGHHITSMLRAEF